MIQIISHSDRIIIMYEFEMREINNSAYITMHGLNIRNAERAMSCFISYAVS